MPPACTAQASIVEAQLEEILASAEFRRSERMCRFLRLVTREALAGNGDSLKEYRIGTEVFDKEGTFDPRVDPIVRNEARRLRRKLETYYLTEGKSAAIRIELPKGTYKPIFTTGIPPIEASNPRRERRILIAAGGVAVVLSCWWAVSAPNQYIHASKLVATNNT